jgi:hypothetical protein
MILIEIGGLYTLVYVKKEGTIEIYQRVVSSVVKNIF